MATTIEQLLEVQELDCRIRDIEKELKDIPARKEMEQSRLDEHRAAVAGADQGLKEQQAQIKKFELEADSRREKITKLRQQQVEIKTNKEFKAMEAEISAVETAISGLEDQELVLMEELEKARSMLEARKKDLETEASDVEQDCLELDARSGELRETLESLQARRRESAKGLDPEWLSRYEHIFERKQDRALVPLQGHVCGGCHMTLPPSVYHDTQKDDTMVSCDFCGRLLYCER